MFDTIGFFLSSLVGILTTPTGLLNLNGLIVYRRELPQTIRITPSPWGIGNLGNIEGLQLLLQAIADNGDFLLAYSVSNNNQFVFHEGLTPIISSSGLTLGTLLGDRNILGQINNAIAALVGPLNAAEERKLLLDILRSISINDSVKTAVDLLFRRR